MVLFRKGLELMSRYQFEKLGKHGIMMAQGLHSFLFYNDFSQFYYTKTGRFSGLIFYSLTGQQWHMVFFLPVEGASRSARLTVRV